jgi:predicted transcriptional regulator
LTADEEASFEESLAQADRGEFATDEQVRAIWAKHGL